VHIQYYNQEPINLLNCIHPESSEKWVCSCRTLYFLLLCFATLDYVTCSAEQLVLDLWHLIIQSILATSTFSK